MVLGRVPKLKSLQEAQTNSALIRNSTKTGWETKQEGKFMPKSPPKVKFWRIVPASFTRAPSWFHQMAPGPACRRGPPRSPLPPHSSLVHLSLRPRNRAIDGHGVIVLLLLLSATAHKLFDELPEPAEHHRRRSPAPAILPGSSAEASRV